MNRSSLENFSKRSAAARINLFGVKLIFRGVEIDGTVAVTREAIELENGGFRAPGLATIRIPAQVQPPPQETEVIQEQERIWYIVAANVANSQNPLAQEHILECKTA